MEEDDNIMPPSEAVILAADAREAIQCLKKPRNSPRVLKRTKERQTSTLTPLLFLKSLRWVHRRTKAETKASIVSSIIRLQEVLRIPNPRPESHWNRMNKPELAQHLADLQTMGHEKLAGTVRKIEEKVEEAKQSMDEVKDQQQREAVIKDVNKLRESKASTLFCGTGWS